VPVVLAQGNCRYSLMTCTSTATATTATSTFTLNSGQGSPAQGIAAQQGAGAFYGIYSLALGTFTATGTATGANNVVAAYDIIPATPSTAITTYTLASGTMTSAGVAIYPTGTNAAWLGVRYNGALVVTLTGASNSTCNALWD
jgi:hypothetical protein